jgi:hypothetical protein
MPVSKGSISNPDTHGLATRQLENSVRLAAVRMEQASLAHFEQLERSGAKRALRIAIG